MGFILDPRPARANHAVIRLISEAYLALDLMRAVHRIGKALCTVAILIWGPVAGLAVEVVMFILRGTLVPGELMYVGSITPSLSVAFGHAGIALAVSFKPTPSARLNSRR
jgi:hypothetical protein